MSKKVTVTKAYIENLKNETKRLRSELDKVKLDRAVHRRYFVRLLKDTLGILGKGNAVSSTWLAEDLSRHLNKVEGWAWGYE